MRYCLAMIVVFACSVSILPGRVEAELLKYQDTAGRVHYVDSLEKIPEQFRNQAQNPAQFPAISKVPPPRRPAYYNQQFDTPAPFVHVTTRKSVEIFVTSWCPYCQKLEAFLKQKKIRYTRYDIERNRKGAALHRQLGGGGVPVTKIGSNVIRGFDQDQIAAALAGH